MDLFAADSMVDADREFNYTSEMACHRLQLFIHHSQTGCS
jgi:hypothetical protein